VAVAEQCLSLILSVTALGLLCSFKRNDR
jgi:hypothetical protein